MAGEEQREEIKEELELEQACRRPTVPPCRRPRPLPAAITVPPLAPPSPAPATTITAPLRALGSLPPQLQEIISLERWVNTASRACAGLQLAGVEAEAEAEAQAQEQEGRSVIDGPAMHEDSRKAEPLAVGSDDEIIDDTL